MSEKEPETKSCKCIVCNGTGTQQVFDDKLNRWVESEIKCKYCKGNKVRHYIELPSNHQSMNKSVYID